MKSVLSVQSHVVHGYVGGRAATFPLQYLGWDVDNINTVDFSNHTGYGFVRGHAISKKEMEALFVGLGDMHCRYDAMISGYIPSADLVGVLADNVALMKKRNPNMIYVCDPVMGDQGHLYVSDLCVEAYRHLLKSQLVDVITPNQFELELLYGSRIANEDDLRFAVEYVHNHYGVKHVVVSSLADNFTYSGRADTDCIYCAVYSEGCLSLFKVPKIDSYFTGVGDMFTALFLDKFLQTDIVTAVGQVLTIMLEVLSLTYKLGMEEHKECTKDEGQLGAKMNEADSMRFFELRVIQARQHYSFSGTPRFDCIRS